MLQIFNKTKEKVKTYNTALAVIPNMLMEPIMESHPEETLWLCNLDMLPHLRDVLKVLGLYSVLRMSSLDKKVVRAVEKDFSSGSTSNMQKYLLFEEWMADAEEGNKDRNRDDPGIFYKNMFGQYICLYMMNEYHKKNENYQFSNAFAYQVGALAFNLLVTMAIPMLNSK